MYKKLKPLDVHLEDQDRHRCLSSIDNQHLKILDEQNSRQSVIIMSQKMEISTATILNHFKETAKVWEKDEWVSREIQSVRYFASA